MGREEKRKMERAARLEAKKKKPITGKNTITLTLDELEEIKKQERIMTQNDMIMFFMSTLPLAEHRVHGFGKKRAIKTMKYVNVLMEGIIQGEKTIEDYRKECEEEVKIRVHYNWK